MHEAAFKKFNGGTINDPSESLVFQFRCFPNYYFQPLARVMPLGLAPLYRSLLILLVLVAKLHCVAFQVKYSGFLFFDVGVVSESVRS